MHVKFGGINIVFVGDMRQLEPVGSFKKPIYADDVPEFKTWINSYIELQNIHQFKDDPEWGALLLRFRNGDVTTSDIQTINQRVVTSETGLSDEIRYATYYNIDRDAINAGLFEERAKKFYDVYNNTNGFIIIFSDKIEVKNSKQYFIPFKRRKLFWEHCGEDDILMPRGNGRMDPVLKLYAGCRIMLPTNTNVEKGQANGTQASVERIILKPGQQIHHVHLDNHVPIMAVFASQVMIQQFQQFIPTLFDNANDIDIAEGPCIHSR